MSRDEARHAGFINDALKDFGIGVDLGFLTKREEVHLLQAEVHLLRDLPVREDRLRALHHDLPPARAPSGARFHPIFKWFEKWCNDEFRHGEAFALLMRADPKLLQRHQQALDPVLPARGLRHDVCARSHAARPSTRRSACDPTDYDFQRLPDHQRDLAAGLPDRARHRPSGLQGRARPAVAHHRGERRGAKAGRRCRRHQAGRSRCWPRRRSSRASTCCRQSATNCRSRSACNRPGERARMADIALPALYALLVWWFSTGIVLYVARPAGTDLPRQPCGGAIVALCGARSSWLRPRTRHRVGGAYIGFHGCDRGLGLRRDHLPHRLSSPDRRARSVARRRARLARACLCDRRPSSITSSRSSPAAPSILVVDLAAAQSVAIWTLRGPLGDAAQRQAQSVPRRPHPQRRAAAGAAAPSARATSGAGR